MSRLHEVGDVWGIHWDWHAEMWFVEPPFDVELDEPIKWFNERSEAFEFVDEQIRSQPVKVSVVDQTDAVLEPVLRYSSPKNEERIAEYARKVGLK